MRDTSRNARHFEDKLAALLVDLCFHRLDEIAERLGLALQHAAHFVRHRLQPFGRITEADRHQQAFEEAALQLLPDACFELLQIRIFHTFPDRSEEFEKHGRLGVGNLREDRIKLGAEAADRLLAESDQRMRLCSCQPITFCQITDIASLFRRKNDRDDSGRATRRDRGHQVSFRLECRRLRFRHGVSPLSPLADTTQEVARKLRTQVA